MSNRPRDRLQQRNDNITRRRRGYWHFDDDNIDPNSNVIDIPWPTMPSGRQRLDRVEDKKR